MSATRQLAAILFADIRGFTSLMEDDEAHAHLVQEKFKKVIQNGADGYGGEVVQFSGDGALCLFRSAIQAVKAAIEIQKQLLMSPEVPARLGIHSGDVVIEGESVYGDGVNVASRIESFAVAGSVLISGKVYDEIKNQKDIHAVSLGVYELKNVKSPVEIFAVSHAGLMVPFKEQLEGKGSRMTGKPIWKNKVWIPVIVILLLAMSFLLLREQSFFGEKSNQDQPKILAVLPFANLNSSEEDEYFTDGICDEILTQVSKISGMNVMSRTSTLQYKGTQKTMKQIGDELGADVLLEGSVQKSNNQVRINVQLINAKNDQHLWAESYDRNLQDIFVIQTDIAKQIAAALHTTLTEKEKSLVEERPTANVKAYDFYLRGKTYSKYHMMSNKEEDVEKAVRLYEQAIKLDPQFLEPYHELISIYAAISWRKLYINSDEYLVKAQEWLDKMLALDIDKPVVHQTLAVYKYEGERNYAGALAELDIVDRMLGNNKSTMDFRAFILRRMGRIDEALALLLEIAEAFPKDGLLQGHLATSYYLKRDFEGALLYTDKMIELEPEVAVAYGTKALLYTDLKGDLVSSARILADASAMVDTNELRMEYTILDMLNGNYSNAITRLLNRTDSLFILSQSKIVPNALLIAIMYQVQGEPDKAKIYFQKAHSIMLNLHERYRDDFRVHSSLGIIMAGLGEKEKAIQEGNKAITMMPVSRDAIVGIAPLEDMALIYTLLGNEDAAIDILEQLLQMPYGWDTSNTIPLLKLHPYWKPLQNNARFQKMVQQST